MKTYFELREINLWNLSDTNKKKTKNTFAYIKALRPRPNFSIAQQEKFESIINEALSKITANEALETIGYHPGRSPKVYAWSYKED